MAGLLALSNLLYSRALGPRLRSQCAIGDDTCTRAAMERDFAMGLGGDLLQGFFRRLFARSSFYLA